jgi:hypothetical protein
VFPQAQSSLNSNTADVRNLFEGYSVRSTLADTAPHEREQVVENTHLPPDHLVVYLRFADDGSSLADAAWLAPRVRAGGCCGAACCVIAGLTPLAAGKEVVKYHSKDGALTFDASMLDISNIPPALRRKGASKDFTGSYLVRAQVTKSSVHKQEQLVPIILWFRPSKLYKVRTALTDLFPSGYATVMFWIHQDNSDGPAADAVNWRSAALLCLIAPVL